MIPVQVTILQPLSYVAVWRILNRYVRTSIALGSQLGHADRAAGRAEVLQREWCGTVAMKLTRTPHVERAMWLGEAVEYLKNNPVVRYTRVIEVERLSVLHPIVRRIVLDHEGNLKEVEQAHIYMKRAPEYNPEMGLLCCEFAACIADDWLFGRVTRVE